MSFTAASAGASVWHDVECASYAADLPLWRQLAAERGGPVLDVGSGTGRVALDLAARGHAVVAIDADPALVDACADRARERGLAVRAHAADARSFDLGSSHPLAILPMQVAQLLGGTRGRRAMLHAVGAHLEPGGLMAVALANPFGGVAPGEFLPPLPDVLEVDGWVLSSTPVAVREEGDAIAVDRHRQAVSPSGELTEEVASIMLESLTAENLQEEAAAAGFSALPAREVPHTRDHVGSTIVMLEAPG